MYEEHGKILTPPDDTLVWRYMNLEKLLALLCDRSLFFYRLDRFRDPWEGVWPRRIIEQFSAVDGGFFAAMSADERKRFFRELLARW